MPTGCPWARRSSCATTSWASSATTPSPASRWGGPAGGQAHGAVRPGRGSGRGAGHRVDRYGGADLTDDEIVALQEILVDTGAVKLLETRIDTQVETAVAALEHASLSDEAVAALAELACYVAGRDR